MRPKDRHAALSADVKTSCDNMACRSQCAVTPILNVAEHHELHTLRWRCGLERGSKHESEEITQAIMRIKEMIMQPRQDSNWIKRLGNAYSIP